MRHCPLIKIHLFNCDHLYYLDIPFIANEYNISKTNNLDTFWQEMEVMILCRYDDENFAMLCSLKQQTIYSCYGVIVKQIVAKAKCAFGLIEPGRHA